MLTTLSINGLAVIESLEIDFDDGFNVITGETGAGKSILIKALGLLLGGKASAETVRKGFDMAQVCGVFELSADHPIVKCLDKLGIPWETSADHVDLLIRRQVNQKGRSKAWVNDTSITVQGLKDIGRLLIDIFGQHDNHKLLDPTNHLGHLDAFLDKRNLLDQVEQAYLQSQSCFREILKKTELFHERLRDRDYLEFRLEELTNFAPTREDYEKVFQQSRCAADLHKRNSLVQMARQNLSSNSGENLSRRVWEIAKALEGFTGREYQELLSEATMTAEALDNLSFSLERFAEASDLDEDEIAASEDRLAQYQELMRKLNVTDVEALMDETKRLQSEINFLNGAAEELDVLLLELEQTITKLAEQSKKLSAARQRASVKVKKLVEAELSELAMVGATFDVEFSDVLRAMPCPDLNVFGATFAKRMAECVGQLAGLSQHGKERAQFLLSANPGEQQFALHKIASGGEISRIMLALKRALVAGADSCLLVFDEIDTGISGKVADIVGAKIKDLSKNFQVICISHLAQVAAYAGSHFVVQKKKTKGRTESQIIKLSKKESTEEIARLLSGTELTKQSVDNARVLMQRAAKV